MIVGQYKIVCNCIIGIVWQWKMFAICSSSRIFSRRAFSSEVRFFLDICYTFCVMLLFYTSWEVYTRLGRSRLARLVRLSNQRAKRQRRTPLSRAPQRAAQGGKQQRAFDEIHADMRQLAQPHVQPRLRRAGEKPHQPPRDGQTQRRRLLPRLPGEKEDDAPPEDGGEKSGNACASSWRHKSPWIPFARISVPDHGLDLECSVENPCARCSCLMIQP